jgi:hypothetical protein
MDRGNRLIKVEFAVFYWKSLVEDFCVLIGGTTSTMQPNKHCILGKIFGILGKIGKIFDF